MIKRWQRERVQGVLLRALDLYDAARIIRGWHSYLVEEPLPDIDELFGLNAIEFKRRYFGTRNLRGNREVLPRLLEDYGLYPWRVQLIAEGPSEIAMLEELLEQQWGFTFGWLGVHPVAVGGADIPENAELLLAAMRPYANYYYLLFDNEGRAAELIEALQKAGTIEGVSDRQRGDALKQAVQRLREMSFDTPEQRAAAMRDARERAQRLEEEPGEAPEFFRWKQNLEQDNFTLPEMCGVINAHAQDQGVEGFALAPETAQQEIDREHQRPVKERRGVATILVDLCESHDPPLRLKKVDFARLLARYAIDHRELGGQERPILEVAEHLVRLTIADRRLQGELR
jgi:hypothetical protein